MNKVLPKILLVTTCTQLIYICTNKQMWSGAFFFTSFFSSFRVLHYCASILVTRYYHKSMKTSAIGRTPMHNCKQNYWKIFDLIETLINPAPVCAYMIQTLVHTWRGWGCSIFIETNVKRQSNPWPLKVCSIQQCTSHSQPSTIISEYDSRKCVPFRRVLGFAFPRSRVPAFLAF